MLSDGGGELLVEPPPQMEVLTWVYLEGSTAAESATLGPVAPVSSSTTPCQTAAASASAPQHPRGEGTPLHFPSSSLPL